MNLPVSIQARRLPHPSAKVTIYYPVIVGLPDHTIQLKINQEIIKTFNDILVEQSFYKPELVEMVANFEIKNNQRGILSLNLIVYAYTGGAHGMTIVKSLTFDTKTGKSFALQDLFKKGSNYEKELSAIIRQDIDKWNIQIIGEFKEIRPDQDFYIADTSLVIYFQLYEISPYAQGFPYFPIALLDVADIIKPNGPLDTMMSFT